MDSPQQLPSEMRALHLQQPSTLTLSNSTPLPTPTPTQYLICVGATAITAGELTWTETLARPSPIPGHDVCGTVVSTPSSSCTPQFSIGDAVIALTSFSRDGAAAGYVVAEARELARKPRGLTSFEGAAVPLSFLTAWQALFEHGQAKDGQSVLILGAAGGVGTMAVQLARWSKMSRIAGTCSANNSEFVRHLGAHAVVDYACEKVEGVFDIVIDCVGGKARDECWQNIKAGGTLVSVAEPVPEEMKNKLERVKCVFFIVEPNGEQLVKASELIERGKLRPVIDRIFILEGGAEAFALLEQRHTRGKIVLILLEL